MQNRKYLHSPDAYLPSFIKVQSRLQLLRNEGRVRTKWRYLLTDAKSSLAPLTFLMLFGYGGTAGNIKTSTVISRRFCGSKNGGWLMNDDWKEYGSKHSWPDLDIILIFAWRNWGKPQSARAISRRRFHLSTSWKFRSSRQHQTSQSQQNKIENPCSIRRVFTRNLLKCLSN
jgi:hypothetical protein